MPYYNFSEDEIERFWSQIPESAQNALKYDDLCELWNCDRRKVRAILHEISVTDNGDGYALVRSSSGRGFYKTNNPAILSSYRAEIRSRAFEILKQQKKLNRLLSVNDAQISLEAEYGVDD